MRIFISVVSHFHHDIIINLGALKQLAKFEQVEVICRDNHAIKKLKNYCKKYNVHYLPNQKMQGFATNNNENYCYAKQHLNLKDEDYFVLLNPDVFLKTKDIEIFIDTLQQSDIDLGVANLFLDREEIVHDDNIRRYPTFLNFIKTYLFNDRSTMVNRNKPLDRNVKYWASCSFMIVNARIYAQLEGLDERYYMYCEDVDFCYRAKNKLGIKLTYLEQVHAVHFRHRCSKQFFSKYFFWHVCSVFKYSFTNKSIQSKNSCLHHGQSGKHD